VALQTGAYSTEVWVLAKEKREGTKTAEMKVLGNAYGYVVY
jgi:hypothetical protein